MEDNSSSRDQPKNVKPEASPIRQQRIETGRILKLPQLEQPQVPRRFEPYARPIERRRPEFVYEFCHLCQFA